MLKMRNTLLLFGLVLMTTLSYGQESFYDFTVKDIQGNDFSFSALKGKKILVVNTASKCGLTPQYKQLENLFETYGGENFTIIGFPANNFANQEPGSDSEIAEFCTKNYGVTFPMMSKISVKGEDKHPLYQWLTTKTLNGVMDSDVSWNFQKYLVSETGQLVDMVEPKVKPDDPRIVDWITN